MLPGQVWRDWGTLAAAAAAAGLGLPPHHGPGYSFWSVGPPCPHRLGRPETTERSDRVPPQSNCQEILLGMNARKKGKEEGLPSCRGGEAVTCLGEGVRLNKYRWDIQLNLNSKEKGGYFFSISMLVTGYVLHSQSLYVAVLTPRSQNATLFGGRVFTEIIQ